MPICLEFSTLKSFDNIPNVSSLNALLQWPWYEMRSTLLKRQPMELQIDSRLLSKKRFLQVESMGGRTIGFFFGSHPRLPHELRQRKAQKHHAVKKTLEKSWLEPTAPYPLRTQDALLMHMLLRCLRRFCVVRDRMRNEQTFQGCVCRTRGDRGCGR